MRDIKTTLFVTTFNWPDALAVCLKSILNQTVLPNEIIIADDGSTNETREIIKEFRAISPVPIEHIWIADNGYRINHIRNLAIKAAKHPFIIQIDGDVILDKNFVKDHLRFAKPNRLNMGRRIRLNEKQTEEICLTKDFQDLSSFRSYLFCLLHQYLLYSTKTVRGLRGCNVAYWKKNALDVNGYDETMEGKGKNDKEFGARLINAGAIGFNLKKYAICYHLDHEDHDRVTNRKINDLIFKKSIEEKKTMIEFGIFKTESYPNVLSSNME